MAVLILTPVIFAALNSFQSEEKNFEPDAAPDEVYSEPAPKAGLEIRQETPPLSPADYSSDYSSNTDGQITHAFDQGRVIKSYQIYKPSGFQGTSQGAILLLHGSLRDGASMVDNWRTQAGHHDFLLIGPDAPDGQWYASSGEIQDIEAILDEVQGKYGFDPARLYVFGHSRGGAMTLALVEAQPGLFAAAGLHAGAKAKGVSFGGMFSSVPPTPIVFIHGTRDVTVPFVAGKESARSFADGGHHVLFYELLGHNHWYYSMNDYINDLAVDFFKDFRANP